MLTHPERGVYRDAEEWRRQFDASVVHVQWDPERSMRGAALAHRSIQVGLSRHVIRRYVEEWTVSITDLTARVRQLDALIRAGDAARAAARLPRERPYPLPAEIGRKITLSPEEWLR